MGGRRSSVVGRQWSVPKLTATAFPQLERRHQADDRRPTTDD